MRRFNDKVVVVTGAAQGIGRATALRLAEEGARVVIFDRVERLEDWSCSTDYKALAPKRNSSYEISEPARMRRR